MRPRRISHRRRREKALRRRKHVIVLFAALTALTVLAVFVVSTDWADDAQEYIDAVFAGQKAGQAEVTLPRMEVYALQLGVYESGERAEQMRSQLYERGVPCIIWQREKMRLICAVSMSREGLNMQAAQGYESCVIKDVLSKVSVKLSVSATELDAVCALLRLPDDMLKKLLQSETEAPLEQVIAQVKIAAESALNAHPEQLLYTQLAQSLYNWCALMEQSVLGEETARTYAAVTLCTLCRELRQALLSNA